MKQETANYGDLGGKCPAQDAETSGQIETINETRWIKKRYNINNRSTPNNKSWIVRPKQQRNDACRLEQRPREGVVPGSSSGTRETFEQVRLKIDYEYTNLGQHLLIYFQKFEYDEYIASPLEKLHQLVNISFIKGDSNDNQRIHGDVTF